jgi:hypothetical protein
MFRPDTRKSGRSIVINTMPATGLSILCVISGITMSMCRNTRSGMGTKGADMAIIIAVGAKTTARGMARATAKVTTETKQDQINCCRTSSYHPADTKIDARWIETLSDKEQPPPEICTFQTVS